MWHIVWRILSRTARQVVIPASLGLALASCGGRAIATDTGTVDVEAAETAPFLDQDVFARYGAPLYAAPMYGAPGPAPDYAAPFPRPVPEPDAG